MIAMSKEIMAFSKDFGDINYRGYSSIPGVPWLELSPRLL
jgi:hypothetical protein